MARFKPGDRVAYSQLPDDCGTVLRILADGPAGALYEIEWDNHPSPGKLAEAALVPCGGE